MTRSSYSTFRGVPYDLVLVDGEPEVFYHNQEPHPTMPAVERYEPDRGVVVVDADGIDGVTRTGYVQYPVVVAADDGIEPNDRVVVKADDTDEVVAIGNANDDGPEMVRRSGEDDDTATALEDCDDESEDSEGAADTITFLGDPLPTTVALLFGEDSDAITERKKEQIA